MKWTQQNRSAYLSIKLIQSIISLGLLGLCIMSYNHFNQIEPDHHLIIALRFTIGMICADLATFGMDFLMVIKRIKFFITVRYIFCVIAFTLGVMT